MIDRRAVLAGGASGLALAALPAIARAAPRRQPNLLIVLCDDLGAGDIGQGPDGPIATPRIDRMAAEGVTLTDFYAAANLCTPSRAGLLTGRYPIRTGLAQGVIMQSDARGLPPAEVTMAEALRPDYTSAYIGKWHLGHVAPYWPPTNQGYDLFFGLPYSHDMLPLALTTAVEPGVELTREDVDYTRLQQRFAERAERFITDHAARPWTVTLALSSPHLPNFPPDAHAGHSDAGLYGDTVEEIDVIVGRLLDHLARLGLERDTLVILTSDNGPWFEGSAGGLRQRKGGGGYEGAFRVPFVARQPGRLPAGLRSDGIAMGIDLLPTICAMAGRAPPAVPLDGRDLTGLLAGGPSPHDQLLLFDDEDVIGIRTQQWKYVVADYFRDLKFGTEDRGYPQLYDMTTDPGERYSQAARQPAVLADMQARMAAARAEFEPLRRSPSRVLMPDGSNVVPEVFR